MTRRRSMSVSAWLAGLLSLMVAGCAEPVLVREGQNAATSGDHERAYFNFREASAGKPEDRPLRIATTRERELALEDLAGKARLARESAQPEEALRLLVRMEAVSADDPRVRAVRADLQRDVYIASRIVQAKSAMAAGSHDQAEAIVRDVLSQSPGSQEARSLQQRLAGQLPPARVAPTMSEAFQKPVTLEFREAALRNVFEALGRSSGVNFVFDKEVRSDAKINVFLKDVTLDEAMRIILATQQLDRKLLNDNSVFIYPNTPGKQREHQELVTRSFYLANADVKQAQTLIKTMVKTRDVYIDERLNLIIIRDTAEVAALVDRLLASIDLPDPEVMLEVEVLEVAHDQLDELGLQYPQQLSYGLPNGVGDISLTQHSDFRATIASPLVVATLHGTSGVNNLLANPKLRARNREKARVQIGEKLPVFTTTSVANVGVSTSVAYLDTGLKLEVEPSVQLDNDVIIKVNLEVSNLIRQVTGPDGSIAYEVGTRNATTSLRLRDGETQILAGLINDEDRRTVDGLPVLSRLPLLGRLFGMHSDSRVKTEVILLITPHVVRNLALPDTSVMTLAAGNDASPGADSLRLRRGARVAIPIGAATRGAMPPAAGDASASSSPAGVLEVSTSGEVAPGQTASVTLLNRSDAIVKGELGIDGEVLEATDGSHATNAAFELAPGDQKAFVFRALPTSSRRISDVRVDIRSAASPDGSTARTSVEGNTTITVIPR